MLVIIAQLVLGQAIAGSGFKNGNEIEITPMQGRADVWCTQQPGNQRYFRSIQCYGESASPGYRDIFVSDEGEGAKKVELASTWENGKVRSKSSKFDSEKGQSKKSFNLLIRTLTQRPLLDVGQNRIDYEFEGGTNAKGSFFVDVEVKPTRYCDPMRLNFSYDCNNTARICDDYFYFNNTCR